MIITKCKDFEVKITPSRPFRVNRDGQSVQCDGFMIEIYDSKEKKNAVDIIYVAASYELLENDIHEAEFVSMITTMCIAIDESRWMCENCKRLTENDKKELMEGCDYQKDLITMLTVVTFDRFGVIRDYLYERDENGEYFFGIPKGNKLKDYLLTSPEDLYEYLAEESEGFSLIEERRKV